MGAVSGFTAITDFTEGYDAITVDDSESVAGFSTVASSAPCDDRSVASSHPASYRNGRVQLGAVKYQQSKNPKRPYSGYKKMIAQQRDSAGTRHLSITNIGVYQAQYERDQIDYKENKKKWVVQKDMDTTLTKTRLKPSNASCGR